MSHWRKARGVWASSYRRYGTFEPPAVICEQRVIPENQRLLFYAFLKIFVVAENIVLIRQR
jgi:hypothetical protein